MKNKLPYIILGAASALLTLPNPIQGIFAFTYDQGRDFLSVARIIYERQPTLIGQTTGLGGIFYGPWWYYFLTPLFILSRGDPHIVAVAFALLGSLTILTMFFLLKRLTQNTTLSFGITLAVLMIPNWMITPTMIWNPSLVPVLTIGFVYLISKIFQNPRNLYFIALGVISAFIVDFSAGFGIPFLISATIVWIFFPKYLSLKKVAGYFLGIFAVISPRILFEFRNHFLMTKTTASYLMEPKVYGDHLNLLQRAVDRLNLFYSVYISSFTNGQKQIVIALLVFVVVILFLSIKDKHLREKLYSDTVTKYLLLLTIALFIAFTIFPDRIWDYYLIGLPVIFIVLVSKTLAHSLQINYLKIPTTTLIVMLVILNFNRHLLPPYKNNWEGNDGNYRNLKVVMEYISQNRPDNYTYYAYSPAIFDYPFDYLFKYYTFNKKLNEPKANAKNIYLIIRESSSKKYLTSGWYGDKTKDKTTVADSRVFPGDILLERHIRND